MRRRGRMSDENQLELSFERQIALYAEVSQSILEHTEAACQCGTGLETTESEAEFNIGLAAACKQVIQRSGLSREEILDRVNARFGRTGKAEDEAKRPVSIHVFNNYLSKPQECRLPTWLIMGICMVTCSPGPLEYLTNMVGCVVITAAEQDELLLGKLNTNISDGVRLRRELTQRMRSKRIATTIKEDGNG